LPMKMWNRTNEGGRRQGPPGQEMKRTLNTKGNKKKSEKIGGDNGELP